MKKIFFILLCTVVFTKLNAQPIELSKILQSYETVATPYFNKIVQSEFGVPNTNEEKAAVIARKILFETQAAYISRNVSDSLKTSTIDKAAIIKLIDAKYKITFSKLPKEFYDNVYVELKKI